MAGPLVSAGASFAAGLRSEGLLTYKRMYKGLRDRLQSFVQLDIPSTRRTEDYFFYTSAPHMVRWVRGEGMSGKAFAGIRYQCLNHRWARSISWSHEDLLDDQTKGLLDQARDLGTSAALVDERVAFQIITNTTDQSLLPAIPNAPDGSALYLAGTRFGVAATGNTVPTPAGVATSAAIQTDYFKARAALELFQDTEGQPLHDPSTAEGQGLVLYNATNEFVFQQAFNQMFNQGSSAAPSNVIIETKIVPVLWGTQRITAASKWFYFATQSPLKALFVQLREALNETIATFENSDIARDTGDESIRFRMRKGYGVHTPYQTVSAN